MSKANRNRQQSARERIAAQQAAARKSEARRRLLIVGGSILAVIAVVVAIVIVEVNKNNAPTGPVTGTALPASVAADITGVPASTLNQVGGGSVLSFKNKLYAGQPVQPVTNAPLVSGGKPEMLYIGAEFCPFCAAMRWSMAVALSRFGSFGLPLRGIHSSPVDTDPSTATLTFYKSSYNSNYLTFTPVENETIDKQPLQNTTSAQQALWEKYDSGPSGVGYPFIDFGNKYVITAPLYDPALLHGLSWAQIAAALHNPASPIAQAALGTANYMTAAICSMTGNKPASVCSTPAITTLQAKL